MNIDTILHFINIYGYLIIFLFLFLGIVGIPAPEESLLFLIGVLIAQDKLSFPLSVLAAFLGAFLGMLVAYVCGKYVGYPFINKYGKYVGITNERWEKAKRNYMENIQKTIVFGFYIPGMRQISPYFAGISSTPFRDFFLLSLLGTTLWIGPFIVAGYYLGSAFNINPEYVPYLGVFFLIIFVIYGAFKYIKRKKQKSNN
ncbi:DedA family protein [Peribacillus muralis]|uniref:DedA family protein n=1 Tax=Peribacillus muralis TaxID=264697 RepID=UPI00070C9458|nr:DedA family protein [Peribacillus muralis]MCK1993140.1 DedA family protein [Peribacillus muralis]MCK2013694.1 DedA family protein [Peribacillus muralis]